MTYLIDTNIISEVREADRRDPSVAAWYASVVDGDLCVSTLVLGEIRRGIERARPRDPHQAAALEGWLRQVRAAFGTRVPGVDTAVAGRWGHIRAIRSVPVIDGLLAATAMTHGLTLVPRNERDVAGLGAVVPNPFGHGARSL